MSIEGGRYVFFSEKKVFEIEMLARYIHSLTVNNLDLEQNLYLGMQYMIYEVPAVSDVNVTEQHGHHANI